MIDNTMTEPSSNPCQLTDDLLPLPEYVYGRECGENEKVVPLERVRAYGDARAAAATERAAQVCDEHASIEGIAQNCAAAIRAGS